MPSALFGQQLSSPKPRRECYALSAGAALGLVCLGKGGSAPGLSDLRLVDRLT